MEIHVLFVNVCGRIFITQISIWVAPSELCEEEILQNIQQTAEAYEKVMKGFVPSSN